MCFIFQNCFRTCLLESQRTLLWKIRSPYSSSSSSQSSLNCLLFNPLALILFTHFTNGTITCCKFKTFPHIDSWWIMQWYFREGRPEKLSSKATAPAALPIIDTAPSMQTLKSLLKSNCWFSRHDFTFSNMSDPLVFPWSDSNRSSSTTLKLSSIPLTNLLNWAASHMPADWLKANEKIEPAWSRFFTCSRTSWENSSMRLVIVCFD